MRSFRSAPTPRSNAAPDKVVRLFQSETAEILEAPEPAGVRATIYVAGGACLSPSSCLSAVTRLDRVVEQHLGAKSSPRTPTAVLQALDPALIKTINVRDGERVKAGDVLATLDPTFAAADVEALQLQIASLDAQIARCRGRAGQDRPYEPPPSANAGGRALRRVAEGPIMRSARRSSTRRCAPITSRSRNTRRRSPSCRTTSALRRPHEARQGSRADARDPGRGPGRQPPQSAGRDRSEDRDAAQSRIRPQQPASKREHQLEATTATRNAFAQQWLAQTSQELVTARNQRDTALQQLEKAQRTRIWCGSRRPRTRSCCRWPSCRSVRC